MSTPSQSGGNGDTDAPPLGPMLMHSRGTKKAVPCRLEPFHIEDFTSVSRSEKEVAEVEVVFRLWNQRVEENRARKNFATASVASEGGKKSDSNGKPAQNRVGVTMLGRPYWLEWRQFSPQVDDYYNRDLDAESSLNELVDSPMGNFPAGAHPVSYFFGFSEFVLVQKQQQSPKAVDEAMTGELKRAKEIISLLQVVANNTNFPLPVLVQVGPAQRALFQGFVITPNYRTSLETLVLEGRTPWFCLNLNGLLGVFKAKLRLPYRQELPEICATIRKTFFLEDWTFHEWTQSPPDVELFAAFESTLGTLNDLSRLPFGSVNDPLERLVLNVTWPACHEGLVVENDITTDFHPMDAPHWTVAAKFHDDPGCLLGSYLHQFATLCQHSETIRQVLGNDFVETENNDWRSSPDLEKVPSALAKITGPTYTLTDIIKSGSTKEPQDSSKSKSGPIKPKQLARILEYLFPDSFDDSKFGYKESAAPFECGESDLFSKHQMQLSKIKSAPNDSLVWRLAVLMTHCLHTKDGIPSVAHLLHEFFAQLRLRWDSQRLLPGLANGPPDLAQCLFYQKLQMLNYCMERKKQREENREKAVDNSSEENWEAVDNFPDTKSNSDDDEFFDCEDSSQEKIEKKKVLPAWERRPEGRRNRLGKLRLLEHDDNIYIPDVQDPAPMTEDQLAEQAEVMLQLGPDSSGSEVRTRMQSASLLSDMESFKAANPGCVLADFVRWHSPRDWDEVTKTLSSRMQQKDSIWMEAWENAKPVPARRQKRLFDDTREAEKVLQYLSSLAPGEVAQMVLPVILHSGVLEVLFQDAKGKEDDKEGPAQRNAVGKEIEAAIAMLTEASRLQCRPEVKFYSSSSSPDFAKRAQLAIEVVRRLQNCESLISRALSLKKKFMKGLEAVSQSQSEEDREQAHGHMQQFVKSLFTGLEIPVIGAARGPPGQLICNMFLEAERAQQQKNISIDDFDFPEEASKEYILQATLPKPYPYSNPTPQRFYALVKKKCAPEFRLAAAFTLEKQFL